MISEIGNLLLSISTSLSLCMFSVVFLRKTINIDLKAKGKAIQKK